MKHAQQNRPHWLIWAAGGVLAAALLIGLVVWALGTADPAPEKPGPSVIPDATEDPGILFDDLYSGPRYIPRFDFPRNEYDTEKFTEADGFLRYDSPGACIGVDVSEFQGSIDWQQVKDAGIDFCILRAGYRGLTQGKLNEDSRFEENLAGAEAAGLKVGVYFFSQAVSESEARKEADFVLERIKGHEITYPVVFDWEPPQRGGEIADEDLRGLQVTGEQVTEFAKVFCERIKKAGFTPCVYTNKHLGYSFFDWTQLKDYDLWYAEYQPAPSFYYGFRIWQYTETGQVPGISSAVDVDICFEDYA